MKLSKHSNHRNQKYLAWLRLQNCVVSSNKAQCAHHVRMGTNGGSGLKPSDYFCIPLLNEYHTTGSYALHIIGEETFFKNFELNRDQLFVYYLKNYLKETFDTIVQLDDQSDEFLIEYLIQLIEEKGPSFDKPKRKVKSKKENSLNDEYYQKAKEAKKTYDKELRAQLKPEKKAALKKSEKEIEYYEKSKEQKRQRDKALRQQMKKTITNTASKEARRLHDKQLREKNKKSQAEYRKEQYQKAKEFKANL